MKRPIEIRRRYSQTQRSYNSDLAKITDRLQAIDSAGLEHAPLADLQALFDDCHYLVALAGGERHRLRAALRALREPKTKQEAAR